MRVQWRSDSGETLVEVLAAVIILGIAGVAIVAGLQLSVQASDIHRKQTTGSAYARSYAEAIERWVAADAGHYVECAGASAYTPALVGFAVPSGYDADHAAAKRVAPDGGAAGPCSGNDTGVQRIDITVAAPDGRAVEELTVLLRKACPLTQPGPFAPAAPVCP
ncbi:MULTISPECIES: type IV pilus modification PilV family protein [unclassified Nocardioides]|uniref:type IV pilus modification PilV family protein n=1 Tax=unclassified Nocardioides TaxID=2615069 RepID=UPI003620AE2C